MEKARSLICVETPRMLERWKGQNTFYLGSLEWFRKYGIQNHKMYITFGPPVKDHGKPTMQQFASHICYTCSEKSPVWFPIGRSDGWHNKILYNLLFSDKMRNVDAPIEYLWAMHSP